MNSFPPEPTPEELKAIKAYNGNVTKMNYNLHV